MIDELITKFLILQQNKNAMKVCKEKRDKMAAKTMLFCNCFWYKLKY